jgi:hypothetical protein
MITAKFTGSSSASVYGLTQWDYGQILHIEYSGTIPEGSEVNYYQGTLSSLTYIHSLEAKIPDIMLQNAADITAYVYIRQPDSGETVLTIRLPIAARPQPDNYVLPDSEEYRRLLPVGGEPGQIPAKQSEKDYSILWEYRADGIKYDGEYVQLMSGAVPVGERVRLMKEEREIELSNDGTNIKWRYTDSNDWKMLISVESIRGEQGPPGITPEFEVRDGHLIAKYNKEGEL